MWWLSITNWQSIKSKSKWLSIFMAEIESRIDYIKCQSVVCWQEQAPIIDFKYWRTKYYTYAFEEIECVLIFSTIVVIMQSVAQKKTHQNKYSKEKKTTKHTKRQKKINKYVYNNIMRRKNFCIYVTAEREIIFFFLICKIEEKRQPLSFYLFLSLLISFSLLLIPHKQITKNICQKKKMRVTSPVSS